MTIAVIIINEIVFMTEKEINDLCFSVSSEYRCRWQDMLLFYVCNFNNRLSVITDINLA